MRYLAKLNFLIKKYQIVFNDILGDMKFDYVDEDNAMFKNKNNEYMEVICHDRKVFFRCSNDKLLKYTVLELPNINETSNDIIVTETIKEIREKGCIIEKNIKKYGYFNSDYFNRVLYNMISKRYAFDKDVSINDIEQYDIFDNNDSFYKSTFECNMVDETDVHYKTIVKVNDKDVSLVYYIIRESNRINKIYDLYNGIINYNNMEDASSIFKGILSSNALNYKEFCGITNEEEKICGKSNNVVESDYNIINNYMYHLSKIRKLDREETGKKKNFN